MKKEVGERIRGDVLFEPPDPLFPEGFPTERRRRFPRFALLFGIIILAVCVWVISVSGKASDGKNEENGSEGTSDSAVYGSETESGHGERETDESVRLETEKATEKESNEATENLNETERDTSDSGNREEIKEVDLSQVEKGEEHVINYSGGVADVAGLIHRGFIGSEERGGAKPLVLVIHTHTSEGYLQGDSDYRGPAGVVSVGDVLVSELNLLGVNSVHCTVIHDSGDGNAYLNAKKTVETMLEIYPSIKYVIDLHRIGEKASGEEIKTVSGCADGSAQIRITVGSYNGDDSWQEDLALALFLRRELNADGRRLCMPVVISPSISDTDLCEYYIMADVGASGNTVDEAMAAGRKLARAFAQTILE